VGYAGVSKRSHKGGYISDAVAQDGRDEFARRSGLGQCFFLDNFASRSKDSLSEDDSERTENDDLRVKGINEKRESTTHPVARLRGDLKGLRVVVENGLDQVTDRGVGIPAGGMHLRG
jgi:hypothetical protein